MSKRLELLKKIFDTSLTPKIVNYTKDGLPITKVDQTKASRCIELVLRIKEKYHRDY